MVGQFEVEPDKLKKVSIELEKYSKEKKSLLQKQ